MVFIWLLYAGGALLIKPAQIVIPQGITSVNGSDVNMGCTTPIVHGDDILTCSRGSSSYLFDDISPVIDTNVLDWASELATVKTDKTEAIPLNHVLLSFGFDTAVSVTSIEMNMFLCPQWSIGAPYITIYVEQTTRLRFNSLSETTDILVNFTPNQSSCDSLSTVYISLQDPHTAITWHILVTALSGENTEWVHVGEIGFQSANTNDTPTSHREGIAMCHFENTILC